jgi:hypothetical protein
MRQQRRIVELGPIIVTLKDGSVFSCTVERVDGVARWVFEATSGVRHIGPPPFERHTPISIPLMVERWYEERHPDTGPRYFSDA